MSHHVAIQSVLIPCEHTRRTNLPVIVCDGSVKWLFCLFWEQDNESKELGTSVGVELYRCFMDRGPLVELRPRALCWVNPSPKTEHHGAVSLRRELSDHGHLLQSRLTFLGTCNLFETWERERNVTFWSPGFPQLSVCDARCGVNY